LIKCASLCEAPRGR